MTKLIIYIFAPLLSTDKLNVVWKLALTVATGVRITARAASSPIAPLAAWTIPVRAELPTADYTKRTIPVAPEGIFLHPGHSDFYDAPGMEMPRKVTKKEEKRDKNRKTNTRSLHFTI